MPGVGDSFAPTLGEGRTRRLAEIYAPCFTLILQLRGAPYSGTPDVLRRRVKDLLERASREARQASASSDDVEMAVFALVAFLDEAILSTDWPQKEKWLAKPLQLEMYERFDAGEAFFERLESLREKPESRFEVLEVYYLCMALGFKGKYRFHGQDQLRMLIEETYAQLRNGSGIGSRVLAPHARPRDQLATEVKQKLPTWVIVVFAVAVGLVVYVGLRVSITNIANEAAAAIEAASQTYVPR